MSEPSRTHPLTLQALFDGAQDAILIADDEGRYLDANGAALSLLQRTREELLKMAVTDLAPAYPVETKEAWARFLREGKQSGEFEVLRPDGTTRVVEFRAKANIQKGQHLSVLRDITERKTSEGRVEHANRARDEFLSVVSHELRSPLNAILGWTRMMRSGSLSAEQMGRALETIERNANVQAKLIDDILDAGRITTGKLRLELQPTEIAAVAEAAMDVVRPAAEAKGVRARLLLDPRVGVARVDPARLQQIIWNLLANAVKFTPTGGRVELGVSRDGDFLEITVSDTGLGIDAQFLPHVFDPFRQADSTVTRSSGGIGLGLSIVKHLAELHGGYVRAQSQGLGRGSLFSVRVPVNPAHLDAIGEAVETSPLSTRQSCPPELVGLRVLVVDDELDARELLGSVLTHCAMIVELAGSAADGMAALHTMRPDLIISDIAMPLEDGYSFVRRIRELSPQDGGATPAIALTAHARLEDRTRALRAGFTNHVGKPLDPTELFAVIGAATGRRRPTGSP